MQERVCWLLVLLRSWLLMAQPVVWLYCCPDCKARAYVAMACLPEPLPGPLRDCEDCLRPRNMVRIGSYTSDSADHAGDSAELEALNKVCKDFLEDARGMEQALRMQGLPSQDFLKDHRVWIFEVV